MAVVLSYGWTVLAIKFLIVQELTEINPSYGKFHGFSLSMPKRTPLNWLQTQQLYNFWLTHYMTFSNWNSLSKAYLATKKEGNIPSFLTFADFASKLAGIPIEIKMI